MKIDYLLTHATIITMNPSREIVKDGALAVQGERIAAIGQTEALCQKYPQVPTIDCRGDIVLPGLINAHSHAGHAIVGKLHTDTYESWWDMLLQVYEHYVDAAFFHTDAKLNACQTIRKGITTSANVMGSTPMGDEPDFAVAHTSGFAAVGVREAIGVGIPYGPYPKRYTRFHNGKAVEKSVSYADQFAGIEESLRRIHRQNAGLSRVLITPHQHLMEHEPGEHDKLKILSLTEGERMIHARVRELAKKYGANIYTDTYGGWISLAYSDRENMLLGPDVLVGMEHVMATNFHEIEILAETNTNVYYTAEGYYKRVPLCALIDEGINLAVTTNACAPRTLFDLLESLRRAMTAEAIFNDDSSFLQSGKALETVTIGAAKGLGWADEIGSLEVGKKADISILDGSAPKFASWRNPVEQVVYDAAGGDFKTVICNGKIVMQDRRILTINEADVLSEAEELHQKLIRDLKLDAAVSKPIFGKPRISYIE